jgi:hypothetical protein
MVTRAQNQNHKPKLYTDGTTRYPLPQALTTTIASAETEPICVTSAIKSPAWRKAMTEKFNALLNNGTWTLVPLTSFMNLVGSKWVFRIKRKSDGSVDRYKNPHAVCKLQKAIYGLKQVPRAWYSRLSNFLLQLGFTSSKSDSSLFMLKSASIQLFALVYVNDIILTGSSLNAVEGLIQNHSSEFPVKDLGLLSLFLGVEVQHVATGL